MTYNSHHRIKTQWNQIVPTLKQRNDFDPTTYGIDVKIMIGDDVYNILSKRDLEKKREIIIEKYGDNVQAVTTYAIDFPRIIEDVERAAGKLLKTKELL